MENEAIEDNLLDEVFLMSDPKHKTFVQKSRTAFLSFAVDKGQIHFSAYLARYMGLMSGDRIGFIEHKNPLVWFIFKTNQDYRTIEIKIRNGTYSINSKEMCNKIGVAFKMNLEYDKKIRLYVNNLNAIPHTIKHPDGSTEKNMMMQLFDVPNLRKDFKAEEEHKEYSSWITNQSYIIKPKENATDNGQST